MIAREPKNFQAYYQRGALYAAAKDRDAAIADYRKAVALNPAMAEAKQALASIEDGIRRDQEAAADARRQAEAAAQAKIREAEAKAREAESKARDAEAQKRAAEKQKVAVIPPPRDPRPAAANDDDGDVTAATPVTRAVKPAARKDASKAKPETVRERKLREAQDR